jgi:hypothetical protein
VTNKAISVLTALTGSTIDPDSDYLPIVDVSAAITDRTKRILGRVLLQKVFGGVTSRSSNTVLGVGDQGKTFVATAGFTQTFDLAATLTSTWSVDYRIESAITVVFDPNGSELIDGATTKTVIGPAGGKIVCTGTAFNTVGLDVVPVSNGGTGATSAATALSNLGAATASITQNSQSAAYPTVLGDAGKHILHPTADNNPRTFTIDGTNVSYPIGTVITFVNQINTLTIAITTDTLTLAGAGTTGSRTLAANGIATALKIGSTSWIISGTGLS